MYLLIFSFILIIGCSGQSDTIPQPLSDGNTVDLSQFNAIQRPDDIPQIRDWKDNCEQEHGLDTVQSIEEAPAQLVQCVLQYVKPNKLSIEVNRSMARGNLDGLFKKYCGYRGNILACVDVMLDKFKTCMTPQQLIDVNVTRRAVDAAITFTCHDDGDRIAVFMAEQGVECLKDHKDGIRECIKERIPEIQSTMDNPDDLSLDSVVINEEQCFKLNSIHQCVVQETTKCPDPTPANILDSLITQMLKATPCWNINLRRSEQQLAAASNGPTSGAANIDGCIKYSLANIGPILASAFSSLGTAGGVGLLFATVMAYLQTVVAWLIYIIFSVFGLFLLVLTGIWNAVTGSLMSALSGVTGSLKSASTRTLTELVPACDVSSWSASLGDCVWQFGVLVWSVVSLSSVLVVALAAVTIANLLV